MAMSAPVYPHLWQFLAQPGQQPPQPTPRWTPSEEEWGGAAADQPMDWGEVGGGQGKGVGKGKGKGMQGTGKGWGGGARAVPLAEFHRQVDDGRAQEWPPRGDWGQGWGAALFGGAQEVPPPIAQPGPDQRGRLEATA